MMVQCSIIKAIAGLLETSMFKFDYKFNRVGSIGVNALRDMKFTFKGR